MSGKADVKCVSDHAEDLADGRVIGVGEVLKGIDTEQEHNQRLIEEGRLLVLEKPEKPKKKGESG